MGPTRFVDRISQTVSAGRVPYRYTHRLESRNIPFRNMQKIFTGPENTFAVPGWPWKPHKSKDNIFLHRSYTPKIFSTKKNVFSRSKTFSEKNVSKKSPRKNSKNPKFFRFFKILEIFKIFKILKKRFFPGFFGFFYRIFFQHIFFPKKNRSRKTFFFSWENFGGIASM